MGSAAIRRLMAEYKQLLHNPPDGVIAGPVNQVCLYVHVAHYKIFVIVITAVKRAPKTT